MKCRLAGWVAAVVMAGGLAGCGGSSVPEHVVVTVQRAPLNIDIHAQGELKATQSTPMSVPGPRRSSRQLVWLLPDGSRVKKGEVVARFSAKQSKQDLAEALIDLATNQLSREGKLADLTQTRSQLNVNMAQVATQLAIANRYANASIEAIARDKILDAVQNRQYLMTKQGVLKWRKGESSTRGKAELAVIGAKRNTIDLTVQQKRKDLAALVLRAPHDGILMLHANWTGQKPQVGASFYASEQFANIPDLAHMEVTLQVPQIQAQGIQPGLAVKLHPLGMPKQTVTAKVTWVAAAAAPISYRSPVKYLAVKVSVPEAAEQRYGWVPGIRFAGSIILIHAKSVLSVPNLALDTTGNQTRVRVEEGGKVIERTVTLGVSGPARSQILSGLAPGARVVLTSAAPASAGSAASKPDKVKKPQPRMEKVQRRSIAS